ncbi:hypothetical protein E2C01_064668 [Portunus trituberculatus]|uniref:Uncharacterized protein n=1 Tax=Portunus trituberculatus TaxID=210409 RepID=A0A5B7HKZ6_PORTR|nr:hypothetical protein [Portunus trituberculatus]
MPRQRAAGWGEKCRGREVRSSSGVSRTVSACMKLCQPTLRLTSREALEGREERDVRKNEEDRGEKDEEEEERVRKTE